MFVFGLEFFCCNGACRTDGLPSFLQGRDEITKLQALLSEGLLGARKHFVLPANEPKQAVSLVVALRWHGSWPSATRKRRQLVHLQIQNAEVVLGIFSVAARQEASPEGCAQTSKQWHPVSTDRDLLTVGHKNGA